jgi:hypothetical protein
MNLGRRKFFQKVAGATAGAAIAGPQIAKAAADDIIPLDGDFMDLNYPAQGGVNLAQGHARPGWLNLMEMKHWKKDNRRHLRFNGFDPDLYSNRSISHWAKVHEQERRDQEDMSILDKFREMAAKGMKP